jgi:AmmeMemoRadiSam system protein B/AmmeMemoRadiSam system protein A
VAGAFYPADAAALRGAVEGFLADAVPPKGKGATVIVAPHAGYVFSGQVAADAWNQARGRDVEVVAILGAAHSRTKGAAALSPARAFLTPLGEVETDREGARKLASLDNGFVLDEEAHRREHSVEVQLPFVQVLFPKAKILPVLVSTEDPAEAERLGRALVASLAGRRFLVAASSDLSHYPPAEPGARIDREFLVSLAEMDVRRMGKISAMARSSNVPNLATCACGEGAILAAVAAAREAGALSSAVASYANSADSVAGDPDRIVGYGAVAFFPGPRSVDLSGVTGPDLRKAGGALTKEDRRTLLALAKESVRRYVTTGTAPLPRNLSPALLAPRGAFVTLTKGGSLRGCMGRIVSSTPLARTVALVATEAAGRDPRFPPVTAEELPSLTVEVSVLTSPAVVPRPEDIVVGTHGVLLEKGGRGAVFLPQVATEQRWSREEMLTHLARKAGLPDDAWKEGARLSVFRAEILRDGGE